MRGKKFLILISLGILIFIILGILFFGKKPPAPKITLVVWGFDEKEAFAKIFADYHKLRPNVKILYFKKDFRNYETELIDALASGKGPDVFPIKNTWVLRHKNKLAFAPKNLISPAKLKNYFCDVVAQDFVVQDKIYGLPLSVDSLVLFWNRKLFNNAGIALPPQTWQEVKQITPLLTKITPSGKIEQSAIALGSFDNISNASQILLALFLQKEPDLIEKIKKKFIGNENLVKALKFYLSFSNPSFENYTWNNELHLSLDAFSEGTLAMMLGFFWQKKIIEAKSPYLDFSISEMPQFSEKKATLASYWAFSASITSKHPQWAWDFIYFMTLNASEAESYFLKTSQPPALRILINKYLNHPQVGVFLKSNLYAQSFPIKIKKEKLDNLVRDLLKSIQSQFQSYDSALKEFFKKMKEKSLNNETENF